MSDLPAHTPQLVALRDAMLSANAALSKVARRLGLSAIRSPEHKQAMACYRAYWAAVDFDKGRPIRAVTDQT